MYPELMIIHCLPSILCLGNVLDTWHLLTFPKHGILFCIIYPECRKCHLYYNRKCHENLIYTTVGNVKKCHQSGCQEMLWKFCPILLHEMSRKCWNFMITGNVQKNFCNIYRDFPMPEMQLFFLCNHAFS